MGEHIHITGKKPVDPPRIKFRAPIPDEHRRLRERYTRGAKRDQVIRLVIVLGTIIIMIAIIMIMVQVN